MRERFDKGQLAGSSADLAGQPRCPDLLRCSPSHPQGDLANMRVWTLAVVFLALAGMPAAAGAGDFWLFRAAGKRSRALLQEGEFALYIKKPEKDKGDR